MVKAVRAANARPPVDVHVLLVDRGRLLLSRRPPNASYAPGLLCLPGGQVHEGEDVVQAAVRTVREVTGIALAEARLRCLLVMHRRPSIGATRVGWFFRVADPPIPGAGQPMEVAPADGGRLLWVDPEKLPADLADYTRAGLGVIIADDPGALRGPGDRGTAGAEEAGCPRPDVPAEAAPLASRRRDAATREEAGRDPGLTPPRRIYRRLVDPGTRRRRGRPDTACAPFPRAQEKAFPPSEETDGVPPDRRGV